MSCRSPWRALRRLRGLPGTVVGDLDVDLLDAPGLQRAFGSGEYRRAGRAAGSGHPRRPRTVATTPAAPRR